ncbi:hypothetical protein O9K51_08049 [Purpureocillium lavendulum]|uniref:Uncharacterized protein n=1 Tax=Purpureocillium lavendulum TaxID=1247861 RepID=A0AB34FKY2_9HYPO|nr:hypothetical protein O9K51_08049 [Purpureocillium lavendulum]
MSDSITITIDLEYDPVKNAELGNSTSKTASNVEDSGQRNALDRIATIQAGSEDSGRSYLSVKASTIQVVKPGHTLFVWHAHFHPGLGRRFQSVVLTCKFSEPRAAAPPSVRAATQNGAPSGSLEVSAYAPRKSFGGCSKESRRVGWGIEFPLKLPGGGLGATPSVRRDTTAEVEHAFTITGTPRGTPRATTCVWTIEENPSTERGIPTEVQFATVIRHSNAIQVDMKASAWTAGGLYPPHHLRTRTPADDRRRVIGPSTFVGNLFHYDLEGDADVDNLLGNWTGEVAGAVLDFQQPIVR